MATDHATSYLPTPEGGDLVASSSKTKGADAVSHCFIGTGLKELNSVLLQAKATLQGVQMSAISVMRLAAAGCSPQVHERGNKAKDPIQYTLFHALRLVRDQKRLEGFVHLHHACSVVLAYRGAAWDLSSMLHA
eukprot:6857319-Prorocentrum_lima.AAC.1